MEAGFVLHYFDFKLRRDNRVITLKGLLPRSYEDVGMGTSRDCRMLVYDQLDELSGDIMLVKGFH